MSTISTAFILARSLLNDDSGLVYGDDKLLAKFSQAHGELVNKFALNSLAVTRERSALITVTAGDLDLGVNLPADLIEPIKMDERDVGETDDNAIDMVKKEFVPNRIKEDLLRIWCWIDQKIVFLGANTNRQVRLFYIGNLTAPTDLNGTLPINRSEFFLGPRVAALLAASIPDLNAQYELWNGIAQEELSKLVRTEVKADQALPSRRRPFSSRFRRGVRISF